MTHWALTGLAASQHVAIDEALTHGGGGVVPVETHHGLCPVPRPVARQNGFQVGWGVNFR